MPKKWGVNSFSLLLIVALVLGLILPVSVKPVSAAPGMQTWSVVDTPSQDNNVIVTPSEINVIAIGSDDRTFYAVDIPNSRIYKSTNGGVWWIEELSGYFPLNALPVWNLAVAPDDVNFLVAVTDGDGTPNGPKRIFVSENGGASWDLAVTGLSLNLNEYISCVGISVTYGNNNRDIAIGTRDGTGTGRVFVLKAGVGSPSWADQNLPPSDVVALKYSPAFTSDSSLVVVSSDAPGGGTFLHLGLRDIASSPPSTNWGTWAPVELATIPGVSPDSSQIITADVELPSDFSGTDLNYRRFYASTDADNGEVGIYRVDDTIAYRISSTISGRISSIAYLGTHSEGVLLAGEVTTAELAAGPSSYGVYIWRTSDPYASVGTPTWLTSSARKSPTGGVGSGFANAQVVWAPEGTRAYCGTSSANPTIGGTAWPGVNQWPGAWLNIVALDESAFSVSPYSPDYEVLTVFYEKGEYESVGNRWNQLSLIDTEIDRLSDVASLEVPETTGAPTDYNILYLASINGGFNNIWRSTSDPPGRTWERVLRVSVVNDVILRVQQTPYDEPDRSRVIVYADLLTQTVGYSEDEGQVWDVGFPFPNVTDLALASDEIMYILSGSIVYRYEREGIAWQKTHEVHSELDSGHTIAVPLKNPVNDIGETADWVIVGEAGPPTGFSKVAWADFSAAVVKFEPSLDRRVELPVQGNVHVITDDMFEENRTIYAASHDFTGGSGKIYRWVIDVSTEWDELEPPNSAFYGLVMRTEILYGVWRTAEVSAIIADTAGADRTLFPRANVPPPPEWDYMVTDLPVGVFFTREPSSLKISSNEYNHLWAIDNNAYDWANQIGCLWAYTDTIAKVGPWTTSPASGDSISIDPVSGRANEVEFRWRQLSYASAYEMQLAKDSDFSIVIFLSENIVPTYQLAPECFFPAGGLVPTPASGIASWGNLESGHTYYWRVRARAAVTGEVVRSPWSATMYFTVESGLPVVAPYPTVSLFSPLYGARGVSRSPSFSWSPMPKTTKYEFVLARDAALQNVVVKTDVPLTSYLYDGKLDFGTNYFWQVRAVEPIVSDPSPIGVFTVVAAEKPVEPVTEEPAPVPLWTWGVIAVCFVLVASMIAFAMVKPRYTGPKPTSVAKVDKVAKLELDTDKPHASPKASSITELELDIDKPPSPFARIWSSIVAGIRRLRYLGKRGDREPGDSPE